MRTRLVLLMMGLLLATVAAYAQSPARFDLKGIAQDTNKMALSYATVMVLKQSDTTLVSYEATDENGAFEFKNLKNEAYILKVTYVGYLPANIDIGPVDTDVLDVGGVMLAPISERLMEVVVRTAKAPLRIKGDTIEYDATTFKVPPGSTVEDLLRQLPGIKVDANGNIQAQGEAVNRVYVDGKEFFGGTPSAATKNLGAETISKVQVYDEKSEEAQLTGIDDGQDAKAMNLELKDEFKQGAFGKASIGGGTADRWASRGNYNRFQ
ncbi:MAG: carboxypeptidase-like regulatory domain-containing protein [Saprospiraceae bacterium]